MIEELTDTRGKYIFEIELVSGLEFIVAGNCTEEALVNIKEYCEEIGEEFALYGYILYSQIKNEDYNKRDIK